MATNRLSKDMATFQSAGYATFFNDMLSNPDPVLRKAGISIQAYRALTYDSRVKANIRPRKSAINSRGWSIVGENESDVQLFTDLVQLQIDNNNNMFSEMQDAALYGYSPIELVYEKISGTLLPTYVVGKPQEWFEYNTQDAEWYFVGDDFKKVPLQKYKFVFPTVDASYVNPYGVGALSSCFWPVMFRKYGFEFWTNAVEKYGMPFMFGTADPGATESEVDSLLDDLASMVQDGVAVTKTTNQVQLLQANMSMTGTTPYEAYINMANLEISMAIAGTNLTTEVKGGSLAAAGVHREIQKDIIDSDMKLIEQTMNIIIDYINAVNFPTPKDVTFQFDSDEKDDLELSKRDKNLLDSNKALKLTEVYYKRNYNYKDDEIILDYDSDTTED